MTILDAMRDPALFGRWFEGCSWDAWRVFLAALAKIIDLVRIAVTETREKAVEQKKSGNHSANGLDRLLAEFGNTQLKRVESFAEGHLQPAKDEIAVMEQRLAQIPTATKGDGAVQEAIEIRAAFSQLTDLDLMAVLEEALASGETEVLSAFFSAPVFQQRSLIPIADFRFDLRRKFQEREAPHVAVELADLKGLLLQASAAVGHARSLIASTSGLSAASTATIRSPLDSVEGLLRKAV